MKRKFLIVAISLIFVLFFIVLIFFKVNNSNQIHLKIFNKTSIPVSNLKITYNHIDNEMIIAPIEPNKNININFFPKEDFNENSLKLKNVDKKNIEHYVTIVGYFEKSNNKIIPAINLKIYINSIDSNGVIKFTVN